VGILLNATGGSYTTPEPIEFDSGDLALHGGEPARLPSGRIWIQDSTNDVLIQIVFDPVDGKVTPAHRTVVRGPTSPAKEAEIKAREAQAWPPIPEGMPVERFEVATIDKLKTSDPTAYTLFELYGRSAAREVGDWSKAGGDLFLRMLKMVSIPLIITSLITGVTSLGRAERLGKMFGRTVVYYLATSMLAIFTGLLMVNTIRPGDGNGPPAAAAAADQGNVAGAAVDGNHAPRQRVRQGKGIATVLFEQVQTMIPPNPIHAAANGDFLSVIAFSIFFAVSAILVGGHVAEIIGQLFEAAFEVMMKMTMIVISLAPLGVLLLMLSATASQGVGIFGALGWYMLTVACALAFHAIIVLPLIVRFVARRNPWEFAKAMSPALLTAFSTASSNGTLPLTLTSVEQRAGISNRVGSFVLPLGATVNMDGTALYEVIAVLFIAQYRGIELDLVQQIIVAFTALLASIGAAGIPHAGLVMMLIVLQAVGLPTGDQGIIIAVDRVLDMCRTSVNVWSDSCGCAVVSRFESDEVQ